METLDRAYFESVRKASATGNPAAQYIKAIVGRVCVQVIDTFSGMPRELMLSGDPSDPKLDIENIVVTLWSDLEHEYFRRANKVLLTRGLIVPFNKTIVREVSVNEVADEVLEEALSKPFMATKHLLAKFTSPIPVGRMLRMAEDMNRPVGTLNAIKARLSFLQQTDQEEVLD